EFSQITTCNQRHTGVGCRTTLTPTAVPNRLAHTQPKAAPLVSPAPSDARAALGGAHSRGADARSLGTRYTQEGSMRTLMRTFGRTLAVFVLVSVVVLAGLASPVVAQTTLRVVMHSDLKIVDPIWTTAYISRNHGYMIYDTLFAMDAQGEIRPQMVDTYEVSPDRLTYTLTLRDGLLWHDGTPVTAEDCIASIKRWGAKDSMGQKMMSFVQDFASVNPKTLKIILKEPTGLALQALGKPSSNVPFMMPKRVAETSPNEQIKDFTGSGPFVFKSDEWKPGDKAVYVKFAQYKARSEAPSGLAGGKVARVDRIEWRAIADQQTAINALLSGEIDVIESPLHDLLPVLKQDANVKLVDINPLGLQ